MSSASHNRAELRELSTRLGARATRSTVSAATPRWAVEVLGAQAAALYAPEGDGRLHRLGSAGQLAWEASVAADAVHPVAATLAAEGLLWLEGEQALAERFPAQGAAGFATHTLVGLPIPMSDQRMGALLLCFADARPLDADARAFYERLSLELALAMQGAELEGVRSMAERREVERLRERDTLSTLLRTNSALSSELDTDRLMQVVTDEATRLCRAQFGAFFYNTISPAGESFTLYTLAGADRSAFENFGLPRNTALFDTTFRGEGIVRLDDVKRDPRYGRSSPHFGMPKGHLPVCSYLAVPVVATSGEVLGGLFFGHEEPGVFQPRDEQLLSAVATQASVALDHARLYQRAHGAREWEARRAALAEEVGLAATAPQPLDEQLQRCAQAIVDHIGAAFARIWLYDEAEQMLVLRASAGLYTHLDGAHSRVPLGALKIGLIASTRQPHLTNEVLADDRVGDKDWARREGLTSFAGYPLTMGNRLLGVLALFARTPLPKATLDLLAYVSQNVSLIIDRHAVESERARFRDFFIGMLGHDLRNPLNAIYTSAQGLMLDEELSEFSRRFAERICNSSARMARMVDQILDFARIRAAQDGGVPVHRSEEDLHEVCRDALEELRVSHPRRHFVESYRGDGRAWIDRDRMAQVFSNLLGNAVTHGDPDGAVRLGVHRDRDEIVIEIHNRGPAISREAIRAMFDPFERKAAKSSGSHGIGLGMYISQSIVTAHGGSISVRSSAGEGTLFTLRLPAREPVARDSP